MAERHSLAGELRSILTGESHGAGVGGPGGETLAEMESRPRPLIPDRYRIRETDEGRFLHCEEAPRVRVSIDRAHAFSEAEARELGRRVILLDGAGTFPLLVDAKNQLYNLDHHEGCERTFTLATCEQTLLAVHSGLTLSEGDWTVYANDPDLDTVLALWCLLNYERLPQLGDRSRDLLFPLIRLEGAIDANGTELARLCGLPSYVLDRAQKRLDALRSRELEVKSRELWFATDPLQFALEGLGEIDRLVYTGEDFIEYAEIEEVYGHVEIGGRRVAVACRDGAGIYEVEKNLKKRWGDLLAIIALENEPGHFTLRRPAAISSIDLRPAYAKLNLLDPAVDGRPLGKAWGGSDNIGGSPRPTGSLLGPRDVLKVLGLAYRKPKAWTRLGRIALASLIGMGLLFGPGLIALALRSAPVVVLPGAFEDAATLAAFSALVVLATWILSRSLSEGRVWLFGWRRPVSGRWLLLAPIAVIAAVPVHVWIPREISAAPEPLVALVGSVAFAVCAVEYLFRGLVHGVLILDGRVQRPGGPWFLSRAALMSSVIYGLAAVAATFPWLVFAPTPWLDPVGEFAIVAGGATVSGLALAMIRERSLSIWPGIALQALGSLAAAGVWVWMGTWASL